MTTASSPSDPRGAARPATVKVWDPLQRMFHWCLVGLFATALAAGDDAAWLHIPIGYAIAGLVATRIAWGFCGPHHARFGTFVRSPREVLAYLGHLVHRRGRRFLGHNPASGALIIALLQTLVATCLTGMLMSTGVLAGARWLIELHEAAAYFTAVLVMVHVAGVIVVGRLHGENLVIAMITGRKRARRGAPAGLSIIVRGRGDARSQPAEPHGSC